MATTIQDFINPQKAITYWRNPTKEDIRFGWGAIHYRDFEFKKCFDEKEELKLKVKASDDKLIYYYSGKEYFTTSKAKLKTISV